MINLKALMEKRAVLLVKAIGLIGAKTEEVRQRTKRRH